VIVRSVVDLARNLRLTVTAEGVEDAATWDRLAELGCDSVQGYYVSKPLAPAAFTDVLVTLGTAVTSWVDGPDRSPVSDPVRSPHRPRLQMVP
jgi:predicted signal transduction protein with EAL and GGDEF domain